ncbi:hypothetical protein R69746_08191 [Paraburkholderia aspalathi]|nr:hypothetical protein R69746_08191 [Paraburkholderia aspalathi]
MNGPCKQEFFSSQIAAMTAAARHHIAGRQAVVEARSRCGVTVYCCKYWAAPTP